MATPVKVRRLSDEEGRQLQRIVRRGGGKTDKSIVKWRRALVALSSAGGNDVAVILATRKGERVTVSRERLRQILAEEGITFQRTKTWKESPDPRREEKLSRIECLLEHERDRTFAFDEFGPLAIKPESGSCWAEKSRPQRLRANYHKPHGTRQLFAWYSIGSDRLYGRIEPRKGAVPTLRALKAIRAQVPDGEAIYVILDNLNHHEGPMLRSWCQENAVELAFTPTYGSWANPIEAHFGPLRQFTIANSDYQSHTELASAIRKYIRWRKANTRDPEVLALERKHRATLRGEAQRRWGQPRARAA